mmetsp:Transcript_69932/g.167865  ORF Transcript_69932/g.167865 Transcript_69932/m.167865 type:complete len:852 (+) Transcript_69932:105-2660(+)
MAESEFQLDAVGEEVTMEDLFAPLPGMAGRSQIADPPVMETAAMRKAAEEAAARAVQKVQPESEFHVGGVAEEVTMDDLLAPLRGAPSMGTVRRQLQKVQEREAVPEPASEEKRGREVRAIQFEATSKSMKKWVPQLQEIARSDQVVLGYQPEDPNQTTADLVGNFSAQDDFEKELEEATREAGATEADIKAHGHMPMNPRIRDEQQTRQVARLKALILREKVASKRVGKIKSKTYRKIHRNSEKREREVLLERLEHENPELAKTLRQEYEKKHAEMRLMRQRNARKKWATTMQRFAKNDKNAQSEISKQAQNQRDEESALRRAIRGKDPDEHDESDVDLSGDEDDEATGTAAQRAVEKAKQLTLEQVKGLETGLDDLPTKGILGMSFMRQAIQRKREAAKGEAQEALKELSKLGTTLEDANASDAEDSDAAEQDKSSSAKAAAEQDDSAPMQKSRKEFSAKELAEARAQVESMMDGEDAVQQFSVAGPVAVKGVEARETLPELGARKAKRKAGTKKKGAVKEKQKVRKDPAQPAVKNPFLDEENDDGGEPQGEEQREDLTADSIVVTTTSASSSSLPARAAGSSKGKKKKGRREPNFKNPFLEEDPMAAAEDAKATPAVSSSAGSAQRPGKRKRASKGGEIVTEADLEGDDDIKTGAAVFAEMTESEMHQRELVRTAFIEGTQEEDFQAEQDARLEDAAEKARKATEGLAGWGSWTGEGIKPKKTKAQIAAEAKAAKEAEQGRSAQKERHSVFQPYQGNGSAEKAKYFVDQVPFEFKNAEYYNQQLKMPTGPEWQTLPNHVNKIKPKFFAKVGAIVPPLQHVKEFESDKQREIMNIWASAKQPKRLKAKL